MAEFVTKTNIYLSGCNSLLRRNLTMKSEILYSAEQINIPEELGIIIKQFTKDAIRTNPAPKDLYKWSANYFAIKSGNPPPFKLDNYPEHNAEKSK